VDTEFNPPASKHPRIAPTERCDAMSAWPCNTPNAPPLRGVVHDPTARRMGGVAGHAGLFGTARDLARFARMLVGDGRLDATQVLAPLTVAKMTSPATPAGMLSVRGLGWDIDTSFSSNRGELFPIGSFGHTGFTGTSIWVDPGSRAYVIFLSSRLHPDGKGDVTPLRSRVATAAAAALNISSTVVGPGGGRDSIPANASRGFPIRMTGTDFGTAAVAPVGPVAPVAPGLDVAARDGFAALKGKRVGLMTNHTGRSLDGVSAIDLIHKAQGVQLVALFSPEHGIRGVLDDTVPSSRDAQTGLPIHSLYGDTRRPTDAMLAGIDVIVVDLQDIGARFYTYAATLGYVMEEAAPRKIPVIVFDRPNPINGWQIEGPPADEAAFIAYLPTMPVRHGMTLGELARLFNEEKAIGATLTVVPAANWRRDSWFDQTGLPWINPSPNMRNLNQATLYPGIGAIEYSNVSVGRGTDQP
ncbi:MAG: exo-beta-N-acetylmuramidase NamZ domain-containing protein, partial [Vicinamibacterales bacterium]